MSNKQIIKPEVAASGDYDRDFLDLIKMVLLELRTHSPFFGVLASEMWIAGPAKNVPTIGVSPRGVVVYNEEFLKSLDMGQIVAVLIHESLHVGLDYWDRFRGCNMEIANWAHDYAINDIIMKGSNQMVITKKNGERFKFKVELPAGGLWDKKFDQMSGEEIYNTLYEEVQKKAADIRKQLEDQLSDPAANEAMKRQRAIGEEMRKSLAAGAKRVQEKFEEATKSVKHTPYTEQDRINEEHRNAFDALRSKADVNLEDIDPEEDQLAQGESPENEQGNPDPSAQQTPSQSSQGQQAQEGASQSVDPFQKALDDLKKNMGGALNDYMGKEHERIGSEYDKKPNGTTRDEHLDQLSDDLDKAAEQYKQDVENAKQAQEKGQEQGQPGQEPGQDGQSGQEQDQGGQPGQGQGGQPGQGQGGQPGQGQGGQPGQGQGGQPGQGQGGQPGQGQGGQPGQGQGGQPGQGQGGQPGQGQGGQPGQGQGGQPGQGQSGPAPTNREVEKNIADTLGDLLNQASRALDGKPNNLGGPGGMTSGDQMSNKGAFDEAMRQLAKEMGVGGLQGDVNIDCSDIKGNPFSHETKEETKERHKQMLQRAIITDAQMGGSGWGSMPAWARREIDGILHPPLSFTKKIKKFIGSYGRPDLMTFKKRNKRNTFEENRAIFPGRKRNSAKVYILMDTSGSMMNGVDMDTLRRAMGLVKRLATSLNLEVQVVQCDAEVTKVMDTKEALREINNNRFSAVGQGGSDFRPGFEFIWEKMKDTDMGFGSPIIVFTDGGITVPERPPKNLNMQVLWVTAPHQEAPTSKWGQHIVMDDVGAHEMN